MEIPLLGSWITAMNLHFVAEPTLPSEEHLESLMQRRLGNRVRDLHIIVRANGMILKGRAATYHAKQLAQHAAMELANLPILANDIEVF
jgi:hypothetical protein